MRIYLAAIEAGLHYLEPSGLRVRNAFSTFYYFRSKPLEDALRAVRRIRDVVSDLLVCDSGAHSFFAENPVVGASASGHTKQSKTDMSPDVYFARYVDFMHAQSLYIDYFVELDIGELVGQDKVKEWRKQLRNEGLYEKVIPCFHPAVMTWSDLECMCAGCTSKYIAVEGDRPLQRKGRLDYTRVIKIAMQHNCRVHGFAMTKKDALDIYPFYSVDSTSWKAIVMYGRGLETEKNENIARFNRHKIRTPQGQTRLFTKEIAAWNDLADYYTALWTKRGVVWE